MKKDDKKKSLPQMEEQVIDIDPNGPLCGKCEYFMVNPDNVSQGVCRRYPPQMCMTPSRLPNGQSGPLIPAAHFPAVLSLMSCGEYLVKSKATQDQESATMHKGQLSSH